MDEEKDLTKENKLEENEVNSVNIEGKAEESQSGKKIKQSKIVKFLEKLSNFVVEKVSDNLFDIFVKAFMVGCCLFACMLISDILNAFRISVHFSSDLNLLIKAVYYMNGIFNFTFDKNFLTCNLNRLFKKRILTM